MRICLVSQEFPPGSAGGLGTQTEVKAKALAGLGHEIDVLTAGSEHDDEPLRTRRDGAINIHELRSPGGDFAVYRPETYWLGYTWAVLGALRRLGQTQSYDIIDFPDYGGEGFAFQIDRESDDGTAVVIHLHGSLTMFVEEIGWPERGSNLHRLGSLMEDVSITSADGLLAASRSIADLTARMHQVPRDLIEVVEGAVDAERFTPGTRARPDADQPRLLFVGNVSENKGVRTAFDALMALRPSHPGVSLTVAGTGDESLAEEMRREARAAGAEGALHFMGFVEHSQLPDLYRSVDVVVAPSHFEGGLGMVYLEAMACGLPVIAARAGGAAEAVVDGETGLLVEPGNVIQTRAAIEALLADGHLRRRLGAAGRRRIEERFSVERYAERLTHGYERARERRGLGADQRA